MTVDWSVLTTIMAVIASAVTIFLAWRRAPIESRHMRAETEAHISEIALTLIEPMKRRIEELEAAKERQRASITELEQRITDLECELRVERSEKADVVDGANKL